MDGGLSVSEKKGFQIFLNSNLAFTVDPTFQNPYFRHHREPMLHFRTQPLTQTLVWTHIQISQITPLSSLTNVTFPNFLGPTISQP